MASYWIYSLQVSRKSCSFLNFSPFFHRAVFYAHLRLFIEFWTTNDTYQGNLTYGLWLFGTWLFRDVMSKPSDILLSDKKLNNYRILMTQNQYNI